jgi:regulator of protease activity HflC (stomatin/prohibitin superfamily)
MVDIFALAMLLFVILLVVMATLLVSINIAKEWERMPVLRLGKFKTMKGPGLFLINPLLETVPTTVDIRTITFDVPSQKTLTKDNIPVLVDAVIFYKVIDPEKAVFAVKNYHEAIGLSATPILRDVIGKMSLDDLLQHRDEVGETMEHSLDDMTRPWGIDVENVEIRDISISKDLEDSISRVASAERERRARAQLAMAEKEIAHTLVEAARTYESDPIALEIRSMNMLYEMCMEGKATTIFIPTETSLQMRSPLGAYGLVNKLGTNRPHASKATDDDTNILEFVGKVPSGA